MRIIFFLVLLTISIYAQKNSPSEFFFLTDLSPHEQIQKLIDTSDYINNKDPHKALEYIEYGFTLIKKHPNIIQERDLYYVKSWAYMELSEFEKADEFAAVSFNLNKDSSDYNYLSEYYNLLSAIHLNKSQYLRSIDFLYKGLNAAEKSGDKNRIAVIYGNLGNAYNNIGRNDEALEYFNSALKMCIETGDSANIAIWHDNIGLILSSQKKYDEALKHSWTANKLYKQLNNTINYYWNFAYLGDIYLNLGEYDKAERYLKFGLNGSKKYGHLLGVVENSLILGRLYFNRKKLDDAYSILSGIEQNVRDMNNYEYLSSIYKMLSEISGAKGNYKKAYEYHLKYSDFSDSVYTSEVQKKIKEVELRYKIDKKENELALLKKSKKLDELELKKANIARNYLVIIFIIASAFLVTFIYIKMRSIKNLEEKQNIINKQKEMLETVNKDLIVSQTHMQNLNRHLEDKVNEEVKKRENQQMLLMQKSKLESLGIFSAGVAHEINQPLTSISFSIENMMYKKQSGSLSDDYLKEKFKNIAEDIKRITNIITHIRIFAREQSNFKLEKFDLNEVVKNSLMIVNTQLQSKDITIELNLSPLPLLALGNKYRLEQVLLNLILNSRYAVEKKEQLAENFDFRKKIGIKTFNDNNECFLIVQDNGIGIAKDKIANVFEPFFTTKEPEDGTGLGLSIAYGIVKEHNGDISVESEENVYSRFTIKLPSINLD